MAEVQEGIQVLFDEIESRDASSDGSTNTEDSRPRDFHQEQYPSYQPPHRRGHNTQQDDFVNFKDNRAGELDKKEGVDNDKYQRLKLPVPFALDRGKMQRLKQEFPGVYFHCRDNGNHDHPYSHLVTMIGTRFMQRRIRPGKRVLDVYGNPNACERFNSSQITANEPKFMKALVNRVGPTDFIREVNKWGPFFDEEEGIERYHRGSLMSMVRSGDIAEYDVLHLTHTLYYVPFEELAQALHAPGKKRVAYALIHKHAADKGTINDGEQTYSKKWVGGEKLVRQVNVATQSAYVHPDLTDVLFTQNKVWVPPSQLACRDKADATFSLGLAWELHIVNDETWIVEFVPYVDEPVGGVKDYAAMWEDDEVLFDEDPLSTPSTTESTGGMRQTNTGLLIPTPDGKFIELDIPCTELFNHLRMRCSGKPRTAKLLEELISTANHMVNPSSMFGDKQGLRCPPDKIYDVAVAAFTVDVPKETLITTGISCMRPVLAKHAQNMKLGPRYMEMGLRDIMGTIRTCLQAVRDTNHIVRSKDPLDVGLSTVQSYLE